jgi:Domain of unknown function (DUF1906)
VIQGVDYSTDPPSIAGLVEVGKSFAGRYVGAGYGTKLLQTPEAQEISDAGLNIVSLVEGAEQDALQGFTKGQEHAHLAKAWHLDRGWPWPVVCYFSVDFNPTASQWQTVKAYLQGAASVIGLQWTGVYGGLNTVKWARADDVARWFFQTYAWSNGIWAEGVHVEQYRNTVSLVGGTVDLDRAATVNYGGWNMNQPTTDVALDPTEALVLWNEGWSIQRLIEMADPVVIPPHKSTATEPWSAKGGSFPNKLAQAINAAAKGAPTVTVDAVALAQALIADATFTGALAAAIAAKLPGLQGELTLSGPQALTWQASVPGV